MIDESLIKSNFLGRDGFIWWIGQVADQKVWLNEKVNTLQEREGEKSWGYRCKVRVIGFHSFDRNELPDNDLPWAHILSNGADGSPGHGGFGKTPTLVGGEAVIGFFLDGEEAQQPVILGCLNRSPAVENVEDPNPFEPFTGFKGKFVKGPTRYRSNEGSLGEVDKDQGSGSQVTMQGDNSVYENLGSQTSAEQQDPGIVQQSDDKKSNAGAKYKPPQLQINFDALFADDSAELAFLKTVDSVTPYKKPNGCEDNILANIHAALQSFIKFVNGLQSTALGFIDPVRNLVVDIKQDISRIARKIAGMFKVIMNSMRDSMFKTIGKLFKLLGITLPSPISFPISEAVKTILDIIFCIFEKLFGPITDFIVGLLEGLLGRANNIPTCAAQEFLAALLKKLEDMLNAALSPILSGLDWLANGIMEIGNLIGEGIAFLQYLLSFLDCDSLKCEGGSDWDPFGSWTPPPDAAAGWAQTLENIDILGGIEDDIDVAVGYLSIFGSADTPFSRCREEIVNPRSQYSVPRLPIGLRYSQCLPPVGVVVGDGSGAKVTPIVASNGSILTVKITNPGSGYTKPPNVYIVDNTNCGKGAVVKSEIDEDGKIDLIYIVEPGQGYVPGELIDVIKDDKDDDDEDTPTSGIGTIPVGIVTGIVVDGPGIGYTGGDTVQVGDCVYTPILTEQGSIIGFKPSPACKTEFLTSPEVVINTKTGFGGNLFPNLQFVPQFLDSATRVGIGTTIINVVDCV